MARPGPALLLAAAAALLLAVAPAANGGVGWPYNFAFDDYYTVKQGSGSQTVSVLWNDGTQPSGVVTILTGGGSDPNFDYGSNAIGPLQLGTDGNLTFNPTSAGIQRLTYALTFGGAQSPNAIVTIVVVPAAATPDYFFEQDPTTILNSYQRGPLFNDFPDASLNWTSSRAGENNYNYLTFYKTFLFQIVYKPPFPDIPINPETFPFDLRYAFKDPTNGGFAFTYPDGWYGEYTFAYVITTVDLNTGLNVTSAPANVTIRINEGATWVNPAYNNKPPPPFTTALNAPLTVSKATILSYFKDPDSWPKPLDMILYPNSASDGGTVVQNADGSLTLTPKQDFKGLVTADIYVTDGFFNFTTDYYRIPVFTVGAIVGKGKPLLPAPTIGSFTPDCSANNGRIFPAPITAGAYSLVGATSPVGAPAGLDFIVGLSTAVNGKGGCTWSSTAPVSPGGLFLPGGVPCATGPCAACLKKVKATFCGKSLRIWVRARAFPPFLASPLASTAAFTISCLAAAQCTGM